MSVNDMDRVLDSLQHKVSVVMPCYNADRFIEESIESVLRQSHQNFELLICDDGSTDSSRQIIQRYARADNRVIPLSNQFAKGAGARRDLYKVCNRDLLSVLRR